MLLLLSLGARLPTIKTFKKVPEKYNFLFYALVVTNWECFVIRHLILPPSFGSRLFDNLTCVPKNFGYELKTKCSQLLNLANFPRKKISLLPKFKF